MTNPVANTAVAYPLTLPIARPRAVLLLSVLTASAVALPVAAHLLGLPVRQLLPMHWPVILAGLVYGWRGGAIVGLLSPVTSTMISGMPLVAILPAMTVELACYGLVTGLLRGTLRWNALVSVVVALLVGRAAFLGMVVLSGAAGSGIWTYAKAALIPSAIAAIVQIATLPLLASWWVKKSGANT